MIDQELDVMFTVVIKKSHDHNTVGIMNVRRTDGFFDANCSSELYSRDNARTYFPLRNWTIRLLETETTKAFEKKVCCLARQATSLSTDDTSIWQPLASYRCIIGSVELSNPIV